MTSISESNKRIARNTIIIYVRLVVTMIVGLFTSRFVLQALGASDFGLYSVVGGLLAMISFLASSLTSTTTRFINFEEGKIEGDTNLIFNVCRIIHIIFALFIFIIAETVGVYYINNFLNVEPGKESDAFFIFQVSTTVACVGLINVPYQGLLMAKEKFGTMATVEIINVLIKFLMVLSLFLFSSGVLRVYALFMSLSTLITFVAYHLYCNKKWSKIVEINLVKTKGHYKEILSFNNWNILSSSCLTIRDQGSNILINFFFGTGVNAAYAVARSVQHYVNAFTANFDTAAGPQITQNFSGGNKDKSAALTGITGRFCMLMMEIIVFPLLVELDFILDLWLDVVPDGTILFTQLILVLVFVGATSAGIVQYINASGKIKWFKIQFSFLYLMVIPIGYILFKNGADPYIILLLFIFADVLSRINQLILLKTIIGFDSLHYMKEAYIRPFIIAAFMIIVIYFLQLFSTGGIINSLINILVTLVFVVALAYFLGLKNTERKKIKKLFIEKIKKNDTARKDRNTV